VGVKLPNIYRRSAAAQMREKAGTAQRSLSELKIFITLLPRCPDHTARDTDVNRCGGGPQQASKF
jgi:hypothetical protein